MEKWTAVDWRFSVKKSIGAFLIVFLFIKNSYRPASDMTYFIDIYLRVKRTEHKGDIRYFIICAKADWCHRIEALLFEI